MIVVSACLGIGKAESKASKARRRCVIYGFLALLFRREPSVKLAESLCNPEIYRSLREAGMDLGREGMPESSAEQLAEKLADDYRDLFISPREGIPLNESLYLEEDGCFNGESTTLVTEFIRSSGLKIDARWTDFSDHVSVEFELMQRLAENEASHWDQNDSAAALVCSERQRTFLREHIGPWVPQLCDAVEHRAKTNFYTQLARLTKSFISEELRA